MTHCARGGIANDSTGWLDSHRDEVIDRVPVLDVGSVVTMTRFIYNKRSAVAEFILLGHLRKPCRARGIILRTLVIQDAAQRSVRRDQIPVHANAFAATWGINPLVAQVESGPEERPVAVAETEAQI